MSSAIIVAAATLASFFALAAAGSPPPPWMWAVLLCANAGSLTLAHRRGGRQG